MKKKFNIVFIVSCISFMFSGCVNTVQPKEKNVVDNTSIEENSALEGSPQIDGFSLTFVHGSNTSNTDFDYELLYLDKKVVNLEDVFQVHGDESRIWNVFDKDSKKYIFFEGGMGCMGCIWLEPYYLIFNPVDFSFEAKQFENYKDIALFFREIASNYSVLSPDKTKIAYVSFYYDREDLSSQNLNEEVRIFDFLTGDEKVVFAVASNETVLLYEKMFEHFFGLIDGAIRWDSDSKDVKVTTLRRPLNEDGTYGMILGFEEYLSYSENIDPWNPENNSFKSFPIDFEGDGISEYAIFYESYDNIGNAKYRDNQHLKVYKIIDGKWQILKEDVAALDNVAVEAKFASINVIDLGADGKQELMVHKNLGDHERKYSVFALHNGEYQDLAIPKGYLNAEKYLKDGEIGLDFLGAQSDSSGITENYSVFCEESEFVPESDKAPCRTFDLFLEYGNGEFYPKVIIK